MTLPPRHAAALAAARARLQPGTLAETHGPVGRPDRLELIVYALGAAADPELLFSDRAAGAPIWGVTKRTIVLTPEDAGRRALLMAEEWVVQRSTLKAAVKALDALTRAAPR